MTAQTAPGSWPIIGHRSVVDALARAIRIDHLAHAYLIAGPEGVGRHRLAGVFAQAVVCTAPVAERPCGRCAACRRAERGTHPDITGLSLATQAAESSRSDAKHTRVSIETVRMLRETIALRPLEASRRVAILEDVDRFSRDAYDALLKTLEEPPPFVVLVLIAGEIDAVPETIRSRCHIITLEPLPRSEIIDALVARGAGAEQAGLIAAVAHGRIGNALTLYADPDALAAQRRLAASGLAMIEDPLAALGAARRLADTFRRGQREAVREELDILLGLWRDLTLLAGGCRDLAVNIDMVARLAPLAATWGIAGTYRGLRATYEALGDLEANVQPRLALDRMVTVWPLRR